MTTNLRLLRTEFRRNAGIWILPAILIVSWYLLSLEIWVPFQWHSTNELLQKSVIPFAGPAIAGVAAWMAGRDRRRGIDELLSTTSTPGSARRLTLCAATTLWGLLAYALFLGFMFGWTTLRATWGGPALWQVVVVVLAILAHAAWGFLLGSLVPSRFTAPVVAIAALGVQQLAAGHMEAIGQNSFRSTWVNLLAAHNPTAGFGLAHWQAGLYAGLCGVALAAIALKQSRSISSWAALTTTGTLVVLSVVMLWGGYPRWDPSSTVPVNGFGQPIPLEIEEPPAPVCRGEPVTVCVHPANEPLLDEAVALATQLAEPLLGLEGVPLQFDSLHSGVSTSRSSGSTFAIAGDAEIDVFRYAYTLVDEPESTQRGQVTNDAQLAIRSWLLLRAGWTWEAGCEEFMLNLPHDRPGEPTKETCAETERFAALSPDEQRTWLEQHYTDLRAGRLELADLP